MPFIGAMMSLLVPGNGGAEAKRAAIKKEILSKPGITNRHMWLYLAVKNGSLELDTVKKIANFYQKDKNQTIAELCKQLGISGNGVPDDVLLRNLRFNYHGTVQEQIQEAEMDLYRLCATGELDRTIDYEKNENTVKETFYPSIAGKQHAKVFFRIYADVLSRAERIGSGLHVYLANSLTGRLEIEK